MHDAYLDAGADLLETNTFNSTTISQADYHLEHLAVELNREGARLARERCDAAEAKTPGQPRFAIGVLGPTSRTASISPDVNNPGFRNVTFDELATTTPKRRAACSMAAPTCSWSRRSSTRSMPRRRCSRSRRCSTRRGARVPIMISGTITDLSGRTLSGQTAEAFWYSLRHARPLSIGLNCALGATDLRAHVDVLAQVAECYVSAHPNAGLPNAFGDYDETPEEMAVMIGEFATAGC